MEFSSGVLTRHTHRDTSKDTLMNADSKTTLRPLRADCASAPVNSKREKNDAVMIAVRLLLKLEPMRRAIT